jgi:hypothetical protein
MKIMAKAAMIFNGLRFSFSATDRAVNWAKQHNGSIVAIFLKVGKEAKEGYLFPSDLDEAENLSTNEDADAADMKVIESNMQMLEHQALNEHIELSTHLLIDPSEEAFQLLLDDCDIIFMHAFDKDHEDFPVAGIDVNKLLKNVTVPVEAIG